MHLRHAILIWRQVDDTNGRRRLQVIEILLMQHLDCVSYKLLVFQRLQQELDTGEPDGHLSCHFRRYSYSEETRNNRWYSVYERTALVCSFMVYLKMQIRIRDKDSNV